MSGFLGGAMADPIAMGLMGLAQGFGNAAMPSRMPIPMGAAFGSAAGGMQDAMTNAQKLRLLAQQEQRLGQQNDIQRQQFEQSQKLIPAAFGALGQMPAGLGGGNVAPEDVAAPPSQIQGPSSSPPANAQEFVQRYAPHAMAVAQETGLDPRLVLAQAGLESAWGTKAPGNNLFGIKGQGQTLATQEFQNGQMVPQQASFRAYDSPDKSFQDYAAFIKSNPRYQSVMNAQGLEGQIDAMGRSGYATDPNYAGKLRMLARGIQIPEGTQPVAMVGGGQPSASADMGAPPAATMPPAQVKAVNNVAQRAWQQASQLQSAAMAMTMNPYTKDMAPILMKQAEEYLKVGMWQPTQLPNGMQGFRHALTGEVKELSQPRTVQTYDQNGMMTTQLDQPGVRSFPQPGATTQVMGPDGRVNVVDQANPQRVVGEAPLSLEQQSAAQVQSGQRGMTPSQASALSAGSRSGAEAAATNAVKAHATLVDAAGSAAKQNIQLDRALQAMQSFNPGPTADWKVTAGRWASVLGAEPKNTSEGEILKSIQSALQIGQVKGEGQVSNFERQILAERAPILFSTPDGARKVVEYLKALNQYDIGAAAAVQEAVGPSGAPDPKRMNEILMDYRSKNPPPPMPETGQGGQQAAAPQQAPQRGNALRWNVQKGAWE